MVRKKVMYSGGQKGSNQGEAGRRLKIGADRILITQGLQKLLVSLNGLRKVLFIKDVLILGRPILNFLFNITA